MNTRDTFRAMLPKARTYAFTPRLPLLQEWNGMKIKCSSTVDMAQLFTQLGSEAFGSVDWLFTQNNLNLSDCVAAGKVGDKNLGKWLKHSHIPDPVISKICAAKVQENELTLTTRYKDFVRMAKSKHLNGDNKKGHTCALTLYPTTLQYYLHKPNTFLLVNRGDDGDFRTRIIGRLTRIVDKSVSDALNLPFSHAVIVFNRQYGVRVSTPTNINGIPCFAQIPKDAPNHVELQSVNISMFMAGYEVGIEWDKNWHYKDKSIISRYDDLLHKLAIMRHKTAAYDFKPVDIPIAKPKPKPAPSPKSYLRKELRNLPDRLKPPVTRRAPFQPTVLEGVVGQAIIETAMRRASGIEIPQIRDGGSAASNAFILFLEERRRRKMLEGL